MSKLLENKQAIHIATEVVVLLGTVYYFSSKNKKLTDDIGELTQRIEEQDERILKLETAISNILAAVSRNTMQQQQVASQSVVKQQPVQRQPKQSVVRQRRPAQPKQKIEPIVEVEEEPDEEELDNEIQDELNELQSPETGDLKKED
jgi:hypothetical protein